MKNFQLITISIFIALAVFGILVFSGAIPLGGKNKVGGQGTVVLWGTVKSSVLSVLIEEFNTNNPTFTLKYVEKSAGSFDQDLLEALAEGAGPDLIFLPDNLAFHYANKIFPVPYSSYPIATFKNSFAGAGEVFLTSKGILAFPLTVDPLMMYYNRTILDANGVVFPPAYWDDLTALVPKLTKKDASNKIIKSAVALGDYININNAKDILAALFMQSGSSIVTETNGAFVSGLNTENGALAKVLKSYTDFADPSKDVYSWNKSFPNSREAFSREDLAFYFGFASELNSLINTNPNQNLAAASLPQIKNSNLKSTAAHVTGIAILAASKNFNTAFTAASLMSTGTFASKFAALTGTAPARRDLLAVKPATDSFSPIFFNSALYARSWLDPSPVDTDNIFRTMVNSVLSNSMTTDGAVSDAGSKLNLLLLR